MATPVVSGAAALVRQFFMDGHCSSCHGNLKPRPLSAGGASPAGFVPSAALLRAALINSGVTLGGGALTNDGGGERLSAIPSFSQVTRLVRPSASPFSGVITRPLNLIFACF